MSASTTRLSLTKPGGGSTGLIMPPDPVDVDVFNANFDKIDDAIGFKNVTSTTKPSTPFDGQPIYETDTGLVAIYRATGAQWIYPNATVTVGDLNALAAVPHSKGKSVHVDSLNVDFQSIDSVWVQQGIATFVDATTRDAEYAKATAAYRVPGAQSKIATEIWPRQWSADGSGSWKHLTSTPYIPLKPTATVTGPGATVTVDDQGVITFTNATALHLDNLFLAEFQHVEATSRMQIGAGILLQCRVRSGAANIVTTTYDFGGYYVAASADGATGFASYSLEDENIWNMSAAWGTRRYDKWEFNDFADATMHSTMRVESTVTPPAGSVVLNGSASYQEKTNALRDGLAILPGTGTITGKIRFLALTGM